MKIGIDIDGVITDEYAYGDNIWKLELEKFLGIELTRYFSKYDIAKQFKLPRTVVNEFFKKKLKEIIVKAKPASRAKDVIDTLKSQGHTIVIITARPKRVKEETISWLKEHEITYDKLIFEDKKGKCARDEGIEFFIEDYHKNAKDLIENSIHVLLMDKFHNKDFKANDLFYRVKDWQEVDGFFKKAV